MADPRRQKPSQTVSRLITLNKQIEHLEHERDRLVLAARAERQSWRTIADALGVSRQAAWAAYREGAATVDRIRSRSALSESEAMALAKEAVGEVRLEHGR